MCTLPPRVAGGAIVTCHRPDVTRCEVEPPHVSDFLAVELANEDTPVAPSIDCGHIAPKSVAIGVVHVLGKVRLLEVYLGRGGVGWDGVVVGWDGME